MTFPGISVVLVEPQGGRNIGAIARVMKNFGFSDLRLVNPLVDHRAAEACHLAVKSVELLEQATVYDDLAAALADCHLAFGTTRRFGRYRTALSSPAEAAAEVAALPPDYRVALVFGREDKGLTTVELDRCQRLVTIPTGEALPSMNIAQAVGLCLYELAKAAGTAGGAPRPPPTEVAATGAEYEGLYGQMQQTLLAIGFLDPANPEHIMRTMRRLLGRQGMNSRELSILRGMLSQIDWVDAERRRLEEGVPGTGDGS